MDFDSLLLLLLLLIAGRGLATQLQPVRKAIS
jgi:hypothetical protein